MANLSDLRAKIEEYKNKYRKEGLPPIQESEIYCLYKDVVIGDDETLGFFWPDRWPLADSRGIYAIFSHDKLLYIGKASQQPIGNRLSSYFRYGRDKNCTTVPGHNWSYPPTHLKVWAVPQEMFFEASALEEFLIRELSNELLDNTAGKKCITSPVT